MGVLPGTVSADPITDDDITIDLIINDGNPADLHDENGWLIAGSGVSSVIRVGYTGSIPLDISYVRFVSVEKDIYGDVAGEYATSLPCETVFSASKNRAGNASILVQINYSVDGTEYSYNRKEYQPIDHATPMTMQSIVFESEVSIGEGMDITMVMVDACGNTVNSLYEDATGDGMPETVTFETTRYAGSGLSNVTVSGAQSVRVPVGADGSVNAGFMVGTDAGPKYLIHIVPPEAVDDKWLTITALADAEPYAIRVSVVPDVGTPPSIPADGASKFHLMYTLSDRYGNPSGNQAINFTSKPSGDDFTWRTNSDGQVKFTFGPFDDVATFNISATAVANTSVSINQEIRFASTSPDDMLLTASPQSMPSADVANATGADIYAKVTDECGNGVPDEKVEFSICYVSWDGAHVKDPILDPEYALTDEDGIATVHFTPGAFETNVSDVDYYANASESCTVVARWGAPTKKTGSIDLEWKNYPYLRVETEVDRETVEVGEPVNVTVRLIGDGWKLSSKPIDVMLCADRSGSMNESGKMDKLKVALNAFNENMTDDTNRVGMISFGSNATWDLNFTTDRNEVKSAIDKLHADGWTSMRQGLYLALGENIKHGSAGVLQAVILLSDGDYNYYGDPLARGNKHTTDPEGSPFNIYNKLTEDYYWFDGLSEGDDDSNQNLSYYAATKNIPVYSIALGNKLTKGGNDTLKKLAKYTGGTYYYAPTGDQLVGIYTSIAGELKTAAGVNTKMDLNLSNIELNNVSQPNSKSDPILEYEYVEGASTLIKSWIGSEGSPNIGPERTLNQTDGWDTKRCLNFDSTQIGTIQLGQTWQAVFRLIPMKPGNINIFGEGSSIFFNDGADSLNLPKTYITAEPDLNATGINFGRLRVYDLECAEAGSGAVIDTYLTMDWNLNYSGIDTVTQCLYYQNVDDGFWTKFCMFDVAGPLSDIPDPSYTKKLYVGDFPPGEYKLRVHAMAADAADSVVETPAIVIGMGVRNYIRLE
ncbi:VWA domain-containing protein [Methanogenium sp. S4BF]|uniref:VWA domain-containing protein n=1 Tax=Methanogenium sp. S4BF TaxID=1789226 RepID=UPI002416A34B|nr:VWA domain-containing protein [Methanogenium sp. S4BF]WFN33570.1 VWA domain-containing protein [Methanogenium sp. S4BF]